MTNNLIIRTWGKIISDFELTASLILVMLLKKTMCNCLNITRKISLFKIKCATAQK